MKRAIQVDHETYAEIVADNQKITIEDFEKFKELAMKKLPRPGRREASSCRQRTWGTTALEVMVTRERGPCGLRRTHNVNVRGS